MKKLFNITIMLLPLLLIITAFILYSKPVLLNINPFYISQPTEGRGTDYTFKKDITPQVKTQLPSGWSLTTLNTEIETMFDGNNIVTEGLIGILIYKEDELISKVYAVGDTGGLGALFYKFPDYDPDIYADLENMDDIYDKTVIEIDEGEYTEVEMFGTQIRRVENRYIQNESENPEEYFGNTGSIFLFYFDNPLFEYCHNYSEEFQLWIRFYILKPLGFNIEELDYGDRFFQEHGIPACAYHYGIYLKEEIEERDLIILDSILDSMEIRN